MAMNPPGDAARPRSGRQPVNRSAVAIVAAVVLVVLGFAIHRLWPGPPDRAVVSPPAATPAPQVTVAPEPPVEAPAHYPIDGKLAGPAANRPFDLEQALASLFGLRTVQSTFRLDDFARRLVATVDGLGQSRASAQLSPLAPTGGRFTVEERDGAQFISADNGLRYTPYVSLLEAVDLQQLAALYVRMYPSLQSAYQDLGYPKGYFNDRMVAVIDQLLATPEEEAPLQVQLPHFDSSVHPERPWVLYEFVEPSLESLSAGQKILLRMGPVNARRVKARLAEFRRLIATPAAAQAQAPRPKR